MNTQATTRVYLDCFDVAEVPDAMFLHAVRLDGMNLDGFPVPVVSAGEFRRFVGALARNDRNGTWSGATIREGDGALIYEDECGEVVWVVVGIEDGSPVYALDGWMWAVSE